MKLSRPTARLIARAQRRAHAFHRFAHHPLCAAYTDELIAIGHKTRVCRGCVNAGLGLVVGGASAVIAWRVGLATTTVVSALAVIGFTLFASSLVTRLPKLVSRFTPTWALTTAATSALLVHAWLATAVVTAASIAIIALYRRRGANRTACTACPERRRDTPCSGYRPILRAERAFVRLSHRFIDRGGLHI